MFGFPARNYPPLLEHDYCSIPITRQSKHETGRRPVLNIILAVVYCSTLNEYDTAIMKGTSHRCHHEELYTRKSREAVYYFEYKSAGQSRNTRDHTAHGQARNEEHKEPRSTQPSIAATKKIRVLRQGQTQYCELEMTAVVAHVAQNVAHAHRSKHLTTQLAAGSRSSKFSPRKQ